MSLRPGEIGPVPEETARVARAAFPVGNLYMQVRDALGAVYDDARFAHLFAVRARPAEVPWRLALVTVLQFAEGLSDRQAADAVRARIDWKYALGPELTDPGFDFSVLCEFRARLVTGGAEQLLLDALLDACRARGYLTARGRQRTDSTRVLGALRVLNRLERVAETLRRALNAVALAAPDWLRTVAAPEWFDRYGRRVEDDRLPRGAQKRRAYAEAVGADGARLLASLHAPTAPPGLWLLPAVEVLRRTWLQQYLVVDEQIRLRDPEDMPPAAAAVETPYEPEARYGATTTSGRPRRRPATTGRASESTGTRTWSPARRGARASAGARPRQRADGWSTSPSPAPTAPPARPGRCARAPRPRPGA